MTTSPHLRLYIYIIDHNAKLTNLDSISFFFWTPKLCQLQLLLFALWHPFSPQAPAILLLDPGWVLDRCGTTFMSVVDVPKLLASKAVATGARFLELRNDRGPGKHKKTGTENAP